MEPIHHIKNEFSDKGNCPGKYQGKPAKTGKPLKKIAEEMGFSKSSPLQRFRCSKTDRYGDTVHRSSTPFECFLQ